MVVCLQRAMLKQEVELQQQQLEEQKAALERQHELQLVEERRPPTRARQKRKLVQPKAAASVVVGQCPQVCAASACAATVVTP